MWDLVADGALLERPTADLRAVALVALRGHAAGHAGGDEGREAGRGVDLWARPRNYNVTCIRILVFVRVRHVTGPWWLGEACMVARGMCEDGLGRVGP